MSRLTVHPGGSKDAAPAKRSAPAAVGHPLFQPYSLVRAIWKQRWAVAAMWVLVSALTVAFVIQLPRTYQAEATVLIGNIPMAKDMVPGALPTEFMDRLEKIKQRMFRHDYMMDFMATYNLHSGDRKSMPADRVVELMKEDIDMRPDRGWSPGEPVTFRITVQGKEPESTMKAANHLAQFFIEENRRERTQEVNAASDFFDTRMTEAKRQVETSEARLNAYKSSFAGELPQQQDALLATLAQARTQLQGVQDALSRSAQTRLLLNNSLELAQSAETNTRRLLDQAIANRKKPAVVTASGTAAAPGLTEVQRLEAELAGLRQRYGEAHPDVRRARARLDEAKAHEEPAPAPVANAGATAPAEPSVSLALEGPERELRQALTLDHEKVETLKAQIKVADQDEAKLNAERVRVLDSIGEIEARIRKLPLREQEMSAVLRDYEMGKERYQSMVDKKLAADLSRELEQKKGAETFQLLDPARLPEEPIKPKRSLLAMGGSIFGLALGLIAAVALEMRSEVLLGEWELPPGTPVLGRVIEVPHTRLETKRLRKRASA